MKVRPTVQTLEDRGVGKARGNTNGGAQECHIFLAGLKKWNSFLFRSIYHVNKRWRRLVSILIDQNVKEDGWAQEFLSKEVAKKIKNEMGPELQKWGEIVLAEQYMWSRSSQG